MLWAGAQLASWNVLFGQHVVLSWELCCQAELEPPSTDNQFAVSKSTSESVIGQQKGRVLFMFVLVLL